MKTLLDPVTEMDTRFRVRQLLPATPARWGKTTAPRVLLHLIDTLAAPLREGDASASEQSAAPLAPFKRWMHLHAMPCPEHKLLVADEVQAATWKGDLLAWQEACTRFLVRGRAASGPGLAPHPIYGTLTKDEWAQILYFHTDHHLRQLGV